MAIVATFMIVLCGMAAVLSAVDIVVVLHYAGLRYWKGPAYSRLPGGATYFILVKNGLHLE